jgi:hypothetical protein
MSRVDYRMPWPVSVIRVPSSVKCHLAYHPIAGMSVGPM